MKSTIVSITYWYNEMCYLFFQAIYSSRLEVVDGASHMVMMEAPIVTNSLIHKFILHGLSFAVNSIRPSPNPTPVVQPPEDTQDIPHLDNKNRRSSRTLGSTLSLRSVKSIPSNLVVSNIRWPQSTYNYYNYNTHCLWCFYMHNYVIDM